jgi:hypothetical protein
MTRTSVEEINLDKIAKRLVYLWNLRDRDPKLYSQNRLGEEKEDIYCFYPEAVELARKYYKNFERR